MYSAPELRPQSHILDVLCTVDLLNDYRSYAEMNGKIKQVQNQISDDDDKTIPLKMMIQLGLELDVIVNHELIVQILAQIRSIYSQINEVEKFKQNQYEMDEMTSGTGSRKLLSNCIELNRLWMICIELMGNHQTFKQQFITLRKLKSLNFVNDTDYNFILSIVINTGKMKTYSQDIVAARQIILEFEFNLPQSGHTDKEILNNMVQVYKQIENIEQIKSKHNETVKLIHIADNKFGNKFKNNDDNVIGNFSPSVTPNPPDTIQSIQHDPYIFHVDDCKTSVLECVMTQRIINSLQFYQTIDLKKSMDQIKLVEYFHTQHTSLLDDHIHVVTQHDKNLDSLTEYIKPICAVNNCSILKSYHRDRRKQNDTVDGINFAFYRDIMDSIHCYIYHLYDIGLRTKQNTMKPHEKQEQKHVHAFEIERHKSKFNIAHNSTKQSETFVDNLIQYLLAQNVRQWEVNSLRNYVYNEDYDTDAVLDDISNDNNDENMLFQSSNVAQLTKKNFKYILEYGSYYKRSIQISDASFSIGYRFYYWDYYQKSSNSANENEYFQNKNFHSGYHTYELHIKLKYKNIKHEILNNKIYTLNADEFTLSYNKAKQYITIESVKQIRAEENMFLHYDIWNGTPLYLDHLLSITLYCDWTDLCTSFSSTFRSRKAFEPIELIKNRNREFAIWSKRLREIVELYGKRGWEKKDTHEIQWNINNKRIKGPFYCGMSKLMVMQEFNIRLCAPTSTSSHEEVATNFAGEEGILIQLNNNGHWHSNNLRIWDCSWLSNFTGEDEKLLMGGFYTIRIQGIKIKKTKQNFQPFFKPLFYYDCMLTGISMLKQQPKITNTHKKMLTHILMYHLKQIECDQYQDHQYIHDTFRAYSNHRKQIVINLHQIHTYFGQLKDLVIQSGGQTWECLLCYSKGNNVNSSRCWACKAPPSSDKNVYGYNNILKATIFQIFQRINHIIIYTTSGSGQHEYVFDVTKLLTTIIGEISQLSMFSKKRIVIEIKATHLYQYEKFEHDNNIQSGYGYVDTSWLSKEWKRVGTNLKLFLNSMKWDINLSQTKNHGARVYLEDTLTISATQ